MRIAVFYYKDYTFHFNMLSELIPKLGSEHQLIGFLEFPRVHCGKRGFEIPKTYLKTFGIRVLGKLVLRSVWVRLETIFEYLVGTRNFCTHRGMLKYNKIPCIKFTDPNARDVVEWVESHDIDVVLIFIGQILGSATIKSAKITFLNKHSSILPSCRGILPVFWALVKDHPLGLTIHKVTEKLDNGACCYQEQLPYQNGNSVFDYYRQIYKITPVAVMTALKNLEMNKTVTSDLRKSYYKMPTAQDYRQFYDKGFHFV